MAVKLTEVLAQDGSKIYIQCDEEADRTLRAASVSNTEERTRHLVNNMTSTVKGYSQMVLDAIKEGMSQFTPDKVTLEFGIQMGGEAGIPFVTKGTAQANVKVTAEWKLSELE